MLTLSEVLRLLEDGFAPEDMRSNPAVRLANLLLDSDIVKFAVAPASMRHIRIPTFPFELGLRRTIVKRIAQVLESKYMKRAQSNTSDNRAAHARFCNAGLPAGCSVGLRPTLSLHRCK